ncbi:WxL domain-containing protein [Vagococcus fessus]|uniref:WxL domain-containing protein n=1 Tax=Vagococcus fessus TaxID=120370 RepID=A0A430A781_9ENTE|nr:WxL domain-containing protein [Vagococcus fessus]RSU02983.1 hypothetical protein CBF31_04455 [Vagococcus fessus]
MKNTFKATAALMLFGTMLGTATLASAEETQQQDAKTTGKLTLDNEGKDLPIDPVDPEVDPGEEIETDPKEPEKPGEPGTPGGESAKGLLAVNFAPNLNFGQQKVSQKEETYNAWLQKTKQGEKKETANFVEVKDMRGSGEGWSLSVAQVGQFQIGTDADKVLKGAKISFKNGEIKSKNDENSKPTMTLGDGNGAAELTAGKAAGEDAENPAATTGPALPLMEAEKGKGMGLNELTFGDTTNDTAADAVTLTIPGNINQYVGAYQTGLEWTLGAAPGNQE